MTQLLMLFTLGETLLYRINSFQITVCRETGEKSSSNIELFCYYFQITFILTLMSFLKQNKFKQY